MVKIQFMVLFYQFYLFTIAFGSAPSKECSSLEVELSKPGGNCIMINTTSSETEKGRSDPIVFINVDCPDHIQSYWLNLPPFAFKNASNRNQTRPFGAFVDIIQTSLTVCCTNAKERHFSPNITFDDLPTKSIKELHQKISSMKVSGSKNYMAMPVNVDKSKKYLGKLHSLPVMVSPADVVLVKKSTFETSENNKLWQSIQGVFLAILLAVLLSLVAGVCIWALETRNNPDEFPRSFARGTSEGFWWAFVTMTTVGYGDRTPKSLFGRLFGIVWIVFGISLFSIVTAAMTSGLMASLGKEDLVKIRGKDVAVLEGSPSVSKAIKAFAIPKVYSDLESMRKALLAEEVEAILVDMFTGFYLLQHSKDKLHVGNLLENPQYFGIVFWKKTDNTNYENPFPSTTTDCLKELLQNHERDVYKVMDKYFERTKKKVKPKENVGLFSMNSPFFKPVFVVLGVLCGLILVFAMVEVLINRTKMADDQIKGETAIHRKEECGLKQLTSKEQSKISKSTELL